MNTIETTTYDDSYPLIKQALQEYDSDQPTLNFIKKNTYIKKKDNVSMGTDPNYNKTGLLTHTKNNLYERNRISFRHNETNDEVFNTEYEVLGIHHESLGIWCWGWSITYSQGSKQQMELCKQMLHESLLLEDRYMTIKSIIGCGRRKINAKIDMDIILALSRYLLKMPILSTRKTMADGSNVTRYLILINKKGFSNLSKEVSSNGPITQLSTIVPVSSEADSADEFNSNSDETDTESDD